MKNTVSLQGGCLNHLNTFIVGCRYLDLYIDPTTTEPSYSLFWRDKENPVQHKMGAREVFNILAQELEKVGERTEIDVQPKHSVSSKKKPGSPPGWIGGPWGHDRKDIKSVKVKPKGIKPSLRRDPLLPPLALGDPWDPDQEERNKF